MAKIRICPADKAFSLAVRHARRHTCEHCKRTQFDGYPKMELAHIYGRANKSVRWDTLNGLCLCHTCHAKFTANPLDFEKWLRVYFGSGYMELLNEKRHQIQKTTEAYRQEVAKHYRDQLRLMELDPLTYWLAFNEFR